MYGNILIPTALDGSDNTKRAADVAKFLASDDATFTFLHVVEDLPGYYLNYLPADILNETRTALQARLDKQAATIPDAKTEIIDGHSGRSIVEWAKENEAGLIVVASHQPALSDYLLGSTASYIVRHAPCCVHVVR